MRQQQTDKPPLIKLNVALFVGLPILALVLVPYWGLTVGYSASQWILAVVFLYLNGLSITAGYHRLWAHKAYSAHPALRWFFAIWGAGALQNSIFIWTSDHRRHHRHVDDNAADPYSAKRGFWYSHIGWILRAYNSNDFSNIPDIQRDPVAQFQHTHYVALAILMNLGLPLLLGVMLGDVIGTLLLVGAARLIVNHHVTFFINSLAHIWGRQPYTQENTARDNDLLAFLTYGEGYHNYHHIFQTDYRNGVRWWQWDPTKWLIYGCSKIGLASNLVRISDFKIQRALLSNQFEKARERLELVAGAERLRALLEQEYELFTQAVGKWTSLQSERYEKSKERLGDVIDGHRQQLQLRWENAPVAVRLKQLEKALAVQRKRVQLLTEQITMQMQSA